MKILSVGEIIWDLYPDGAHIGGAPFNFAAHMQRLGFQCHLLTALGQDALARDTMTLLANMNFPTDYVQQVDLPTGRCQVTLDENAVPTYHLAEGVSYDAIPCPPALAAQIGAAKFDALYFGTLFQRGEISRQSLAFLLDQVSFPEIFCDVNVRLPHCTKAALETCCAHATILKISQEELPFVLKTLLGRDAEQPPEAARLLAASYPNLRLLILTLGQEGALVLDATTNTLYRQAAKQVQVVSTVGAGDSFSAAFLAEYLRSRNIPQALDSAIIRSAYVCSRQEAIPPEPQQ